MENELRSGLKIANREVLGASGACAFDLARKSREQGRTYAEPSAFIMWMQYEVYSLTKLIPEWKSSRYHKKAPKIQV